MLFSNQHWANCPVCTALTDLLTLEWVQQGALALAITLICFGCLRTACGKERAVRDKKTWYKDDSSCNQRSLTDKLISHPLFQDPPQRPYSLICSQRLIRNREEGHTVGKLFQYRLYQEKRTCSYVARLYSEYSKRWPWQEERSDLYRSKSHFWFGPDFVPVALPDAILSFSFMTERRVCVCTCNPSKPKVFIYLDCFCFADMDRQLETSWPSTRT